jgi:alkylhydroperoxidase family enzyme
MPRLPFRKAGDFDGAAGDALRALEATRGFLPNLYRAAANAPAFIPAFVEMVAASRAESALPSELKELAILRIAHLTRAETMWTAHLPLARAAGLSTEVIAAVESEEHGALSAAQLAVLAFTDESTRAVAVSDGTWANAAAVLNEEQLAELVFVVAFYNMVARLLVGLEVEPDPRYTASGS